MLLLVPNLSTSATFISHINKAYGMFKQTPVGPVNCTLDKRFTINLCISKLSVMCLCMTVVISFPHNTESYNNVKGGR